MVKNPPTNDGDARDKDSIPGSGRSLKGGNGNLLQYSCLKNSMDRAAWWGAVHGVAELDVTELLSMHTFKFYESSVHFSPYGTFSSEREQFSLIW